MQIFLPSYKEPQPATKQAVPAGGSRSEGRQTGVTRSDRITGELSSTRAMSLLNVFGLNYTKRKGLETDGTHLEIIKQSALFLLK